jgi:hypothetical protein
MSSYARYPRMPVHGSGLCQWVGSGRGSRTEVCATRFFRGRISCPATLAATPVRMRVNAFSLDLLDEISTQDRQEIHRTTFQEVLEVNCYPVIEFMGTAITTSQASEHLFRSHITGALKLHGAMNTESFVAHAVMGEGACAAMAISP